MGAKSQEWVVRQREASFHKGITLGLLTILFEFHSSFRHTISLQKGVQTSFSLPHQPVLSSSGLGDSSQR